MVGARTTKLLSTSLTGVISPRLRVNLGQPGGTVTFTVLVRWAELFYRGPLSEEVDTGLGIDSDNPSRFQIVWDDEPGLEPLFIAPEKAVTKVMYELRKEAARLAQDPANLTMSHTVFDWLVNDVEPYPRESRLREMRERVCRMIGSRFNKETGYQNATKLYM